MEQNNNRFLLHRKFVKQNQSSWESLLRISRSQLSTALRIITLSDQISDMHREISWFVSFVFHVKEKEIQDAKSPRRFSTMGYPAPVS
jgi:predicted Zn-dependent protease